MDHGRPFNVTGFIIRWMMAMFLVFATYNPSGRSYYHWAVDGEGQLILKAIVGMFLAFCFWAGLDATRRALHPQGLAMTIIFTTFVSWWLVNLGLVDVESRTQMTLLFLVGFASVIGIGLSYSHIHYRITGIKQIEET